jgi:membrane dipeptidase
MKTNFLNYKALPWAIVPIFIIWHVNQKTLTQDDASLRARAGKLHRQAIVIDTHNDVTSTILAFGFDLGRRGDNPSGVQYNYMGNQPIPAPGRIKTHTDLRRMKAGGMDAQFFSIWADPVLVNKKPSEGGGAARRALEMIDAFDEQVRLHSDVLEMAYTVDDIRRIAKKGKIAALMGMEGGHAIENSLGALRIFYKLGVRYMTLTHSNTNDWSDSSGDINDPNVKHHNGLTDFGRELVREMNKIGMMVDISHVSDKTFYDVIEVSRAPVIASHSSARALADHPRNVTDDMLIKAAQNGGVVMINFYDFFIDQRKARMASQWHVLLEEELYKRFPNDWQRVEEEMQNWLTENSLTETPLSALIDHIDHVAKVAGIDHVGLGSDFDGVPSLPEGMKDISQLPNITFELMKRGYSDTDIKKVLGENLLRVMSKVEQVATEMKTKDKI